MCLPKGSQQSSDLTRKRTNEPKSSSKISHEQEGDYETVSSSTLEAIHALRILPAKPLQESEYADRRCVNSSGTTSYMTNQHTYSQSPPQYLNKNVTVLERRNVPNAKGQRMNISECQNPVPPPRPLKTLPKQYQPLPPEPKISSQPSHTRKEFSQAHTFPVSAKRTRHLSVKEGNEAPRGGQVRESGKQPELSFQTENSTPTYHSEDSLPSTRSSKDVCSSGSVLNIENLSVKRSPSATLLLPHDNKSKHSLVKREMESLVQPIEKDLNKYEWYIGEYDRHEAEAALLQENTDETFLVRDCSKKSSAEPYVLVVYYGKKVYNIKVRFLEESQQYALGTGLRGDDKFNSVKEIIDFYKYVPITLIDGKDKSGNQREQCYLTNPFTLRKKSFLP
ncbi:cytokine-dependent hematopoietic cell linker [Nothoprocta perdicaria]|uniref:cytokine-dependent hematopoietic cell linker n=1 Tax=Nothoprocta perdicaria TaxID=30464 RepID=UPI000E1BCA75|nr:cytokine-dependent hematopoietic cell linker [Nothoprocta perdicaria]